MSSPSVTIRTARPEDAETIADFNARLALETESKQLDMDVLLKGVREILSNSEHGIYFIAEHDGTIVGQTMITYEWSDWRNGQFWWIQSVYVTKEWRGRKVFTELYEHIMERAKKTDGVCGIRLYMDEDNERARKTYVSLGLNETSYHVLEVEIRREEP